jgi:membrane-associated phospholipid phosphatase
VLGIGTAIALVVFAAYPTMPPRLMPPGVKTVDTASTIGGLWSYNHGVIEHIADPYAAMPSLHIVWSGWIAYVLSRRVEGQSRWRWAFWVYPVLTGFTIIATGVHWVLDLAGGAVVLAIAITLANLIRRRQQSRRPDRDQWPGERGANRSTQVDSTESLGDTATFG